MVRRKWRSLDNSCAGAKNYLTYLTMENAMGKKKILVTGGSGLLGRAVLALSATLTAPLHGEMDITSTESIDATFKKYSPEVVLHLAAATKPPEHEKDPTLGLTVNIIGTANLALACHKYGVKLVYVSTDYVYSGEGPHKEGDPVSPPSRFVWSKLGGESAVQMLHDSLILRLSFGPVPFPWEKVYENQHNSKLYVDEIAPLILAVAGSSAVGVMNIGGPRMSLLDYAKRTRSDIETIPKPDWVPSDTSLDITLMKKALDMDDERVTLKHKQQN